MAKIKVLQCVSSLGIGGNPIFVMNFFRAIDKEKFQVDFVIFNELLDFYDEVIAAGSRVYIAPQTGRTGMHRWLEEAKFVYHVLKEQHYDVIHCHNCAFKGLLRGTLPGKLVKGTKVIAHSHSTGLPKGTTADRMLRGFLKRLLCWSVDYGFACSDLAGESKYTEQFMKTDKYQIIHNAIDSRRYQYNERDRAELREKLHLGNGIVIGNVGRLSEEKNQTFLLEILSKIRIHTPEAKLLIVGGGHLENTLRREAEVMEIGDSVRITGMVPDAERYYSAMDVFVMPSLHEGLPFTAVEAQMNGLGCVFADTITKMADIMGNSVYLSLENSAEHWGENIMKEVQVRSKLQEIPKRMVDYDIYREAERLEKFYAGKKE